MVKVAAVRTGTARDSIFEEYIRPLESEALMVLYDWLEANEHYETVGLPSLLDHDSLKAAHQAKGRIEWLRARKAEIDQEIRRRNELRAARQGR